MKKNSLVCPKNCTEMNANTLSEVNGSAGVLDIIKTIVGFAYKYGYQAAGTYAKQNIWTNGKIPLAAKIGLMAAFPDPIGWLCFINAFNAA